MTILVHQCPHCLTERMALNAVTEMPCTAQNLKCLYLWCQKCRMPSCAVVMFVGPGLTPNVINPNDPADLKDRNWNLDNLWPAPPAPVVPRGLPQHVQRAYIAAESNFPREGMEEASAGMYRRALDIGIAAFDPTVTGTLYARIEALARDHKIAPDIAAWAHGVRLGGNDAMHDPDEITRPELVALRGLSEMVMTYLFQMPAMLVARKTAAEPKTPG